MYKLTRSQAETIIEFGLPWDEHEWSEEDKELAAAISTLRINGEQLEMIAWESIIDELDYRYRENKAQGDIREYPFIGYFNKLKSMQKLVLKWEVRV